MLTVYPLFSVDDHIIEPPRVWLDRVPQRYQEAAPQVVERDGVQVWQYEGRVNPVLGLNAVVGKSRDQWNPDPMRYEDMLSSCYIASERANALRSQGIYASVNFPTLPRFGGALFLGFEDKALAHACVVAYNDFILDEWCAAAPEVFVPMVICQLWDTELAEAEIRRCASNGARALCFPENPQPLGLPGFHDRTGHWDPIFRTCEELSMPICMHIGSSGVVAPGLHLDSETPASVGYSATFAGAAVNAINMMYSPLPRRFPNVRLVWSEGGIGWVPAALERADRQFLRHMWEHPTDDVLPSEIARRNMWFCMIEEPLGMKYRHDYTVDRILWESDFPHADTPYPETQLAVQQIFEGVPEDEIRAISYENAERLFDFPFRMPEGTGTPAPAVAGVAR